MPTFHNGQRAPFPIKNSIVKQIAIVLALGCLSAVPVRPQPKLPSSPHFKIHQLAPGVWAAINNNLGGHAICNAGIIDLGNKTVVFDPFMNLDAAADLKKAAIQLTGRAPRSEEHTV